MQGLGGDEGQRLFSTLYPFLPCFFFSDLDGLSALTVSDTPIDVFSTPPQLDGELITLTLLPRSRWQTLLNLEVIQVWNFALLLTVWLTAVLQQRNKPKEPPKVPEQAPFFLPTLPGVETRFVPEVKDQTKDTKTNTRRLEKAVHGMESVFAQKLAAEVVDGDCKPIFTS